MARRFALRRTVSAAYYNTTFVRIFGVNVLHFGCPVLDVPSRAGPFGPVDA